LVNFYEELIIKKRENHFKKSNSKNPNIKTTTKETQNKKIGITPNKLTENTEDQTSENCQGPNDTFKIFSEYDSYFRYNTDLTKEFKFDTSCGRFIYDEENSESESIIIFKPKIKKKKNSNQNKSSSQKDNISLSINSETESPQNSSIYSIEKIPVTFNSIFDGISNGKKKFLIEGSNELISYDKEPYIYLLIYNSQNNKKFLFQISKYEISSEVDGIFDIEYNDAYKIQLLNKYFWMPYIDHLKKNINIGITAEKDYIIFIEIKNNCNFQDILIQADRDLFDHKFIFKNKNAIMILILNDKNNNIKFENEFEKLNHIEQLHNVKIIILNINNDFENYTEISKFPYHDAKFKKIIEDKIQKINQVKTHEFQKNIKDITSNIINITSKFDCITSNIVNITSKIDCVTSKMDSITSKIDCVTSKMDSITSKIDCVTSKMDSITSKIDCVTSKIDSITSKIDCVTSKMDSITSKIDCVTSKMDSITSKIDCVTSKIDFMTREMNSERIESHKKFDLFIENIEKNNKKFDFLASNITDLIKIMNQSNKINSNKSNDYSTLKNIDIYQENSQSDIESTKDD